MPGAMFAILVVLGLLRADYLRLRWGASCILFIFAFAPIRSRMFQGRKLMT